MESVAVGIISAPNLPADIAQDLKGELSDFLSDSIDKNVSWKIETLVDPLIGVAENTNEILGKVGNIKKENDWNYAICLTDLPLYSGKHLVMADASVKNSVAQISIPTFGCMPMRRRIKQAIIKMMAELYCQFSPENSFAADVTQLKPVRKKSNLIKKMKQSSLSLTKRVDTSAEKEHVDIRYMMKSPVLSRLRVLLGMTFANRPWTALFSFNKLTTLSFATGSYIAIFSTPWKLSIAYTPYRFIALMMLAILGTIIWVIFSHDLWEKATEKGEKRWRDLYNWTTFITLGAIVVINYCLLFFFFLIAIALFVPPELFKAWTGLDEDPSLVYYFGLVWLITSLGTLAGAIGTGVENKEKIRDITYSYRQKQRYYEIEKEEEKSEQKSY
ncbi:hypothetical protein CIL05_05890 [Virgibacillus profundi]|uniref:5,10-methylene-tetrahydrofolate dehydrogenase n=1 Tax=Virgibacillus profundi TaxID=2024555 RepID=A0A2A2IF49_9BACI|nr:hypothetical protein [Virgibacillus profundi]PAV30631.1 hypothetical protein CIL05_05890 [Virgibacillus profundi]PXY54803.1 hypothetical protein CIT14_05975 [Virgibacillus profundi]